MCDKTSAKSLIKMAQNIADSIVKKKIAKMEEQRKIEKKDCMIMKKKLDQFKKVETLIGKVLKADENSAICKAEKKEKVEKKEKKGIKVEKKKEKKVEKKETKVKKEVDSDEQYKEFLKAKELYGEAFEPLKCFGKAFCGMN